MRVQDPGVVVAIVLMPGFTLAQGAKPAAKERRRATPVVTPDHWSGSRSFPGVESARRLRRPGPRKGGVYVLSHPLQEGRQGTTAPGT